MEDVSLYVKAYRDLRDKKAQLDGKFKESIAPITEMMDKIEARLLQFAAEQGVNSFATEHGTAYKNKATYCKVADWDAFQGALVEKLVQEVHDEVVPYLGPNLADALNRITEAFKQSDFWDYLTRAANKVVITERANAGEVVPGIDLTTEFKMGFRAPTKTRS